MTGLWLLELTFRNVISSSSLSSTDSANLFDVRVEPFASSLTVGFTVFASLMKSSSCVSTVKDFSISPMTSCYVFISLLTSVTVSCDCVFIVSNYSNST